MALRDDLSTDLIGTQSAPVDPTAIVTGAASGAAAGAQPVTWFEANWPWVIGGAVVLALVIHFIMSGNARRKRR